MSRKPFVSAPDDPRRLVASLSKTTNTPRPSTLLDTDGLKLPPSPTTLAGPWASDAISMEPVDASNTNTSEKAMVSIVTRSLLVLENATKRPSGETEASEL